MATEIVPAEHQQLTLPGEKTRVSYEPAEGLTYEEWEAAGNTLRLLEGAVMWWIGDWLRFGERQFGQRYAQALKATGYEYQTLNAAQWVSGSIDIMRRRINLSWSHHREVAALEPEEQDHWLDRAEAEQLSHKALRKAIRDSRPAAVGVPTAAQVTQADWREWLPGQPACDLLLTDPPYSTDVGDIRAFAAEWLPEALAKVKPTGRAYVCIGAYPEELAAYLAAGRADMTLAQVLVWTYRNTLGPAPAADYKLNWQAILYFRGAQAGPLECPLLTEQFSVQDINAPDGRRDEREDAWQKPDELAERFVRHASKPGELVLDPFAGTGTFLIAAASLGRDARGCDHDPDKVAIARRRGCCG